MVYLFYNKVLLRVLILLAGVGVALATYHYVALSAEKLPETGARNALEIVSFLVAGWLVMLIAEVVDNHYVRVFGTMCMGFGAWLSHGWIFTKDGPALLMLPDAPTRWPILQFGYWSAVVIAALLLVLLVTRLIIDKLTLGRPMQQIAEQRQHVDLGQRPAGMGEKQKPGELAAIPIDTSPLAVSAGGGAICGAGATPASQDSPRTPGPVQVMKGIGGLYDGSEFQLAPGRITVGRQDADILLADDTQVSRAHAVLVVDEQGMALIEDNGSTNGTFLNNERVQTAQLAPGDMLRIGTTLFRVEA
ncbi:MAG: FHA domain-containing protein [bacterium]|nr:FHA domain-containing protein [bacterium]